MLAELLDRYRRHDRRALSRLLTLVSRGEFIDEIAAAIVGLPPSPPGTPGGEGSGVRGGGSLATTAPPLQRNSVPASDTPPLSPGVPGAREPKVIAITGSAGVGKSTFVGRLIAHLRHIGKSAAVLACDPQSPLTGGALLGDVFRMASTVDDGLFLRSLATPGGKGGVADHVPLMLKLLAGFGFEVLIVETVGSGQGDVTVREFADVVVLLTQPHTGDELQWEKAGILEIADAIVVHKADLPGADLTAAQLRDVLSPRPVPIALVSSAAGRGIPEAWRVIETLAKPRCQDQN